MAQKDDDLVIGNWQRGIGPSPHLGFGDMRNVDIDTNPGVLMVNLALNKVSGSVVTGRINWLVRNPEDTTQIFGIDQNGVIYRSSNNGISWEILAGNTAGGRGQGLAIWKNFLFVAYENGIDVYGPLNGNPSWHLAWKTDLDPDSLWHPMLVSKSDGKLYGGAGRYIFSVKEEIAPFDPETPASFVWTKRALDLPSAYRIKCLAELGNDLMAGTWVTGNTNNIVANKIADIFPWNRSNPSFGQPIQLGENGVHAMITRLNVLYICAGVTGKIFSSNGYQAVQIAQIPEYVVSVNEGGYYEFYPGSIMNHSGRIMFGLGGEGGGGYGVWSLLPTSDGTILNLENIISTGYDGTNRRVEVSALLPSGYISFLAGWRSGTDYGIDSISGRYSDYKAFVDSPFYTVGTNLNKRTFTQGEFQLAKSLVAGEGIKLQYRTDLGDGFHDIGTFDYTTLGAITSHNFEPNIPSCENLQIRVLLTAPGSTNATPELKTVTLK